MATVAQEVARLPNELAKGAAIASPPPEREVPDTAAGDEHAETATKNATAPTADTFRLLLQWEPRLSPPHWSGDHEWAKCCTWFARSAENEDLVAEVPAPGSESRISRVRPLPSIMYTMSLCATIAPAGLTADCSP